MVNRFLRILAPLNIESKLEVLSKISEKLKFEHHRNENDKEKLMNELFGSWGDVDDNLSSIILNSRTISTKEVALD